MGRTFRINYPTKITFDCIFNRCQWMHLAKTRRKEKHVGVAKCIFFVFPLIFSLCISVFRKTGIPHILNRQKSKGHFYHALTAKEISCRCKDSYFESVQYCEPVFSVVSLYTHTVIIYFVQQVLLIKLEKGIYHVMTERKTSWRCKDASFECGDNKAAADDGRCSVACLQKVFSGWIFHPLHNDDAPDSMH